MSEYDDRNLKSGRDFGGEGKMMNMDERVDDVLGRWNA